MLEASQYLISKLHYRTRETKTARHRHKNRRIDQRKRTEDPEINPCSYIHLILSKGCQRHTLEKRNIQLVLGKLNIHM
jgi:hypothetical protein